MRSPASQYTILGLSVLIVTFALAHAWAAPAGEISLVTADDDGKRIVISCKGSIGKHHAQVIGGPNRLVIDFQDMRVDSTQNKTMAGKGSFKEVRLGHFKGRARLVVDFEKNSVPTYEVRREQDKVYVLFNPGTSDTSPAHAGASSGKNSRESASDSPLSPTVVPAAAPSSGAPEKPAAVHSDKAKAGAARKPVSSVNSAPQTTLSSQGAVAQRPEKKEKAAEEAPGSQETKLAQRMDLNRPGLPPPPRREPTERDPGTTGPGATQIPSSGNPGPGERMVSEVRPPVTPPTPDPRLVVQEITELKFIQVGHNSRLVIRGGDRLDYRLNKVSPTKVRMDLVNAEIPKVHQKPLRTDLFSTSVEMIVPGSQTIFVQLKDAVPYQVQKQKGVLMIDFPPPRMALTEDQKAALKPGAPAAERERAGRESYERERETVIARRGAARLLREEEFRRKSETLEKQIGLLLKEQEELLKQRKEVERKYRITPDPEVFRKPVTMDFQGISLRNAFKLLAEQAGINIIVGTEVTGATTMRLFQVPLGQVIDHILQTHNLDRDLVGNVMWVGDAKKIAENKDKRLKDYQNQLKQVDDKLAASKKDISSLEKERDKTVAELEKGESEAEKVAEEKPEVETVAIQETIKIEVQPGMWEDVTFVMEQIKLNYTKASEVVPVLECVFNHRCLGRTRAEAAARGAGAAGMPVTEQAAEGGSQQAQSFEQLQQQLQSQGILPGNPVYTQYVEQWRRDNLAAQSLAMRAERTLAAMGAETGTGIMDIKMKRILAHTILMPEDKYNLLIVKDTPERLVAMKRVIASLDLPTPQVVVETRIVHANKDWSRSLGILWGGRNRQLNTNSSNKQIYWGSAGETTSLNTAASSTGGTIAPGTDIPSSFVINLPPSFLTPATVMGLGMQFGLIPTNSNYATDLDVRLQLGEGEDKLRTIGRPKIQTLNRKKAVIKKCQQIAYLTTSPQFGTQTQLVDICLELEVTPVIYPDGRVEMKLTVKDEELGSIVNGQPSILKRNAETTMILKEGETGVIGGIVRTSDQDTRQGWPGLMNVPVLNFLFSNKTRFRHLQELLIFLTPTIVKRPPTAA